MSKCCMPILISQDNNDNYLLFDVLCEELSAPLRFYYVKSRCYIIVYLELTVWNITIKINDIKHVYKTSRPILFWLIKTAFSY